MSGQRWILRISVLAVIALSVAVVFTLYSAGSWPETLIKAQVQLTKIKQTLTAQHDDSAIVSLEADLYQQLHAKSAMQLERQIIAQLNAANGQTIAEQRTAYLNFAHTLSSNINPEFENNKQLMLTRAKLNIELDQPNQAQVLVENALSVIGSEELQTAELGGESLHLQCKLHLEFERIHDARNSCSKFYQWTQQSEVSSDKLKRAATFHQALVHWKSNEPKKAQELFNQLINLSEDNSSIAFESLVNAHIGYAAASNDLGQYDLAEQSLNQALKLLRSMNSDNIDLKVELLYTVADHFAAQGKYQQAFEFAKQALKSLDERSNQDMSLRIALFNQIGSLSQDLGKYDDALSYYKSALTSIRSTTPDPHPDTAAILNNLGSVSSAMNNYSDAKDYHQQALKMRLAIFDENHPEVISSEQNLALVFDDLNETTKAINLLEQSMKKVQKSSGHPKLASVMAVNLARMYIDQGDNRAGPLLKQALVDQQNLMGSTHPDLLPTIIGLADFYRDQQQYFDAEVLLIRAVKIAEEFYPQNHPDIANCLFKLARLYQLNGETAKAEHYYQKELAILIHNNDLDGQKRTLKRLLEVSQKLGNNIEAEQISKRLKEIELQLTQIGQQV